MPKMTDDDPDGYTALYRKMEGDRLVDSFEATATHATIRVGSWGEMRFRRDACTKPWPMEKNILMQMLRGAHHRGRSRVQTAIRGALGL